MKTLLLLLLSSSAWAGTYIQSQDLAPNLVAPSSFTAGAFFGDGGNLGVGGLTITSSAAWCTANSLAVTANVVGPCIANSTFTLTIPAGRNRDVEVCFSGSVNNNNSGSATLLSFLENGSTIEPWKSNTGKQYMGGGPDYEARSFCVLSKNKAAGTYNYCLAPTADGTVTVYIPRSTQLGCVQFYGKALP